MAIVTFGTYARWLYKDSSRRKKQAGENKVVRNSKSAYRGAAAGAPGEAEERARRARLLQVAAPGLLYRAGWSARSVPRAGRGNSGFSLSKFDVLFFNDRVVSLSHFETFEIDSTVK
ncbi:MAG: hypothetical protein HY298_11155 [Verrucomicrobia bacterium]|nr:hypothetical protein [Verrucomicrobiota bacterium]